MNQPEIALILLMTQYIYVNRKITIVALLMTQYIYVNRKITIVALSMTQYIYVMILSYKYRFFFSKKKNYILIIKKSYSNENL
jgi:hypothetical protein